jgi:hypothetical protein
VSAFQFRLQRILDWRRTQLELEEAQYRRQVADLAEIDRKRAEAEAAGEAAERVVRAWNPLGGDDLKALGAFRIHVKNQELELVAPRAVCVQQLDNQHRQVLEARRRLRLLEKLKERRKSEWQAADEKQMEELASESYLAKWQSL